MTTEINTKIIESTNKQLKKVYPKNPELKRQNSTDMVGTSEQPSKKIRKIGVITEPFNADGDNNNHLDQGDLEQNTAITLAATEVKLLQCFPRPKEFNPSLTFETKLLLAQISRQNTIEGIKHLQQELAAHPIDTQYHPNKVRLKKEYASEAERQKRKKNNEASKKSRDKKKAENQVTHFCLNYVRNNNQTFILRNELLLEDIRSLEAALLKNGADEKEINEMREHYLGMLYDRSLMNRN